MVQRDFEVRALLFPVVALQFTELGKIKFQITPRFMIFSATSLYSPFLPLSQCLHNALELLTQLTKILEENFISPPKVGAYQLNTLNIFLALNFFSDKITFPTRNQPSVTEINTKGNKIKPRCNEKREKEILQSKIVRGAVGTCLLKIAETLFVKLRYVNYP